MALVAAINSSIFPGRITTLQTLAYIRTSGWVLAMDGVAKVTFRFSRCKSSV